MRVAMSVNKMLRGGISALQLELVIRGLYRAPFPMMEAPSQTNGMALSSV